MIQKEWIRRTEKELSADDVRRLEPGCRVTVLSADRHGESQRIDCSVVQYGKKKALAYMNKATFSREIIQIKEYPNKLYLVTRGI